MIDRVEFGKQLKALRAYHNMSQGDAGAIIGVKKLGYLKRENGQIDFTLTELHKIAVHFGKSITIEARGIFLS